MFPKIFSVLAKVVTAVPIVKDLWYAIKKDVPRVLCPACNGSGKAFVYHREDKKPDPLDVIVQCPVCSGAGKVRETDIKNRKE